MAGIAGFATRSSTPPGDHLLRMAEPLKHRNWYAPTSASADGFEVSTVGNAQAQTVIETESVILALHGEIFPDDEANPDTWRRTLLPRLLEGFRIRGADALCGLNGSYVAVLWEKQPRRLTIIGDRYGFRRLYLWESHDMLAFASEAKAFRALPGFGARLDLRGAADVLSVGYPLDNRTLFQDVSALPPACVLTCEQGRIQSRTYWTYDLEPRTGSTRTTGQLMDEWLERITRAVRVRVSPSMCVQITGGLDSRILAGILSTLAPDAVRTMMTIGRASCLDVRRGGQIARGLGFRHTHVPTSTHYAARLVPALVSLLEGAASASTAWMLGGYPVFEEERAGGVFSGFFGGCLSGSRIPEYLAGETDPHRAAQLLYRHSYAKLFAEEELERILCTGISREVRGESSASITTAFLQAPSTRILGRCDFVDLHQRQRRFIATHLDVIDMVTPVRCPYTDATLVDFALGLPQEARLGRKLYREMIIRKLPQVARFPYGSEGRPLSAPTGPPRPPGARQRLLRTGLKALSRLGVPVQAFQTSEDCFLFSEAVRRGSRGYVEKRLRDRDLLGDLLVMPEVERLLREHMARKNDHGRKISGLLTLAEFLHTFTR